MRPNLPRPRPGERARRLRQPAGGTPLTAALAPAARGDLGRSQLPEPALLANWLESRGVDYTAWTKRHPQAASGLPGAAVSGGVRDSGTVRLMLVGGLLVALVLVTVSLLPGVVVAVAPKAHVLALRRVDLARVGIALLFGVAVLTLLRSSADGVLKLASRPADTGRDAAVRPH